LKLGVAGAALGLLGLGLPGRVFMEEALGLTPDPAIKRYDAIIQIFYNGGPSQTDTWDPKPGSPNNIFATHEVGANDIYGKPIYLTQHFPNLTNLIASGDPSYGLGIVRSVTHGNGAHPIAEGFMNCFWQSPVANVYPSTAAVMSYYLQGQSPLGVPSVVITGNQGVGVNDAKGAKITTALNVGQPSATGQSPMVQALQFPPGITAPRAAARKAVMDAVNKDYLAQHPDNTVAAWEAAWNQAYGITTGGQAYKAFDLTNTPTLPGGTTANVSELRALTLAQQLVENGIPYVSVGIGGNDTHLNNTAGVTMNWGDTTDPAVAKMAQNLKASGKRVLVVMGGEFGRTPNTVAPNAQGVRRDGRDHFPSGFSWAFLSVNQPLWKTTAVGDTGPDGMWTTTSTPNPLVDPVYPGAIGGMLYRSLGYPVATGPAWDVPIATGVNAPPVDATMATAAGNGNTLWLMNQFGIG
jgi:hypothetical protein